MSVSSRVLRKFQGDDLKANHGDDGSDIDVPFQSSGVVRKQLNINRYDLLNQNSQSESEVKEDDDDQETVNNEEGSRKITRESTKKKKKKKKKKTGHGSQRRSSEDMDEVERSVREVNALLGDMGVAVKDASMSLEASAARKGVLYIEHKHLNPRNELKRIFGSKIIETEQNKRKGRRRGQVKNTWLVTPKDNWPPIGKLTLTMEQVGSEDGYQYFAYHHTPSYQNVQKKFFEAVESLDPKRIVAIANSEPYHVDTMLQLSDICRMSEDLALAAELIERALFSLESAFHPQFNLAKGVCRLDYRRQENRALFIALFKHLIAVGQRACYRTALEFCKVILSLHPEEDPLAIVLTLDFYAIKAREYAWLIQFVDEMETRRNLSQLPNIAYSKAVAQFYLSGGGKESDTLLQDALLLYPGVLHPMLDKCGVQSDPQTNAHSYFLSAESGQSGTLNQLVQLYVHRSYHVWKDPELLSWLERNTIAVLHRVNSKDPIIGECCAKRERWYKAAWLPREMERHIYLSDMKEVMASLGGQGSGNTSTFSFDPLPPLDSIDLYTPAGRATRSQSEYSNAVSLFFRSLMPNFDVDVAPAANNDEELGEAAVNGAAGQVYLHRSVNSLLEAMRDLLANLQPVANNPDTDEDNDELDDFLEGTTDDEFLDPRMI